MVKVTSLAGILFSACVVLADEPRPSLTLEATVSPAQQRGFVTPFRVRLVGAGKDVSVVTEGLTTRVVRDGKRATVTLALDERRDEKGRPVVRSAAKLGIVRLQPGEVAAVPVPATPDLAPVLAAAVAGEVELVVEYEVAEAVGKRYGVVSGKVRGTASVTK